MNYLAQWFDFEYWSELGEILTNLFACVLRGDVTPEDARDYLIAIGHLTEKKGTKA